MADLQTAEEKYKESIRKRMGEISGRRANFWKPKVGPNRIRILRAKGGDPWFYDVVVHYGLGPEGKDRAVCNVSVGENHCEACDDVAKYKASARRSDQERAEDIRPNHQCLMNILDLEGLDKGPQIWASSETRIYELMEYYVDPEWGDFTHPTKGYEIRIKRTGTGRNDTKYGPIKLAKNPSPLPDAKTVLGALKDLSKVFRKISNEEMRVLLDGGDQEGGFACFGVEYSKDEESCDTCEKGNSCRKVYFEARKAAKAAKNGKDKPRRRFEEDDDMPF